MLNRIWAGMLVVAAGSAVATAATQGRADVFGAMGQAMFDSARTGFELALGLAASLALWLGVTRIAQAAGLVQAFARGWRHGCRGCCPTCRRTTPRWRMLA